MKSKPQIFLVHGGDTFKTYKDYLRYLKTRTVSLHKDRWQDAYLDKKLGRKFEIIRPRMPLSDNAKYEEWKIHFERFFPYLRNNIILIGSSLGGMFLAKYLSEKKFPKKISAVFLVCPPFDDTVTGEPGESLATARFKLKPNLSLLEKNAKKLILMFSADDPVVPISHAEKYRKKLKNAKIVIYKSKNGHFLISRFPEIIRMIKNL